MALHSRVFVREQNGWKLADMPSFDPVSLAYGVAHDTLEHLDNREGIEAEMMAFGAIYQFRILSDWWSQFPTRKPVDLAQIVMIDVFRFLREQDFDIKPCPSDDLGDTAMLSFFSRMFTYLGDEMAHTETPDKELRRVQNAYWTACKWIAKGRRRVTKRFHGHEPVALRGLFENITNRVEMLSIGSKPGDILNVNYCTNSLTSDLSRTCVKTAKLIH